MSITTAPSRMRFILAASIATSSIASSSKQFASCFASSSSSSSSPPYPTPPPPPSHPVTYYTCRHNYEKTLTNELLKRHNDIYEITNPSFITSPCPGLLRVEHKKTSPPATTTPLLPDPIYALQIIPHAVEITAPSVNTLATAAMEQLSLCRPSVSTTSSSTQQQQQQLDSNSNSNSNSNNNYLRSLPRGSLLIHSIVPQMLKGTPRPHMDRRARLIATTIRDRLRQFYPCARRGDDDDDTMMITSDDDDGNFIQPKIRRKQRPEVLLQLLLLTPDTLVASLSPLTRISHVGGTWPSVMPAGLAHVELLDDGSNSHRRNFIPSSAFRKLLEGMACMNKRPPMASTSSTTTVSSSRRRRRRGQQRDSDQQHHPSPPLPIVVDLGASPGGWTGALLTLQCPRIIAVDRSPLVKELMMDDAIEFVKGDAFSYDPPSRSTSNVEWMVSDVIAHPERVEELLMRWCGGRDNGDGKQRHQPQQQVRPRVMIVTMKFRGEEPTWEALDKAMSVARERGYGVRVKHFFNNKNEVTLMLGLIEDGTKEEEEEVMALQQEWPLPPMFPAV